MLSLNAHQLNVFLTAADTLNFTQAAQRLKMTQPSVSQHIQALEELFGLPLFVRVGRNIQLTDAGKALIPLAQEMLYLAIHMEESMASLKGDVYGHLVVGCSTVTGRYILPKLLTRFHELFPQVRATCMVTSQEQALEMLQEGKINLALASDPPVIQEVETRKIGDEQIVLACHPSHPWAQQSFITIEDLLTGEFIHPDEGSEVYTTLRKALAFKGIAIPQLKPLVYLGTLEGIALSIQEGLGVGFIPETLFNRLVKDHVCKVPIQGLTISQAVYVCRSSHRPATIAQEAFWNIVTDLGIDLLPSIQKNEQILNEI